jgi:hypothetical protein
MGAQATIYEKAAPVSRVRHGGWSVKKGGDYSFAKKLNSIPLLAVEFMAAVSEYAIVFVGGEAVMPVVILGMRDEENSYLHDDGGWRARYVPAFLRRYPFVFSTAGADSPLTLCIDEAFAGCNQDGLGERLFGEDGKQTPYLDSMLGFLKQEQREYQRTRAFCGKLKGLDLLESAQAQMTSGTGRKLRLSGFMAINRERLKQLTGDQLTELVKTGELDLVYLHLFSMRNLGSVAGRTSLAGGVDGGSGS